MAMTQEGRPNQPEKVNIPGMLVYYLRHLAAPPLQPVGMKTDEYKTSLDLHKTASDQFRDSVNFAFDLMVTKTVLPLLTLLLGYLFGSKKN